MNSDAYPTHKKFLVVDSENSSRNNVTRKILEKQLDALQPKLVRISVEYSSLNFKDALCASGHPGIAKKMPLIPGIDAAGTVIESTDSTFTAGQKVMVFHADFGTSQDGGYSTVIDVPASWVYPLPKSLTSRNAMTIGTAGFTAAQSVDELEKHDITPDSGPIVVSGATGGVGICSVVLLNQLGYEVTAVSGKPDRHQWLTELGAAKVIDRENANDQSGKPLLPGRWAGAIDTVGGPILSSILRSTKPRGCVTACGLVAGFDLSLTVYPFILRGVTLQGVDTAGISREYRTEIWNRLGNAWTINRLDELAIEVSLEDLETQFKKIRDGRIAGRVIVKIS